MKIIIIHLGIGDEYTRVTSLLGATGELLDCDCGNPECGCVKFVPDDKTLLEQASEYDRGCCGFYFLNSLVHEEMK